MLEALLRPAVGYDANNARIGLRSQLRNVGELRAPVVRRSFHKDRANDPNRQGKSAVLFAGEGLSIQRIESPGPGVWPGAGIDQVLMCVNDGNVHSENSCGWTGYARREPVSRMWLVPVRLVDPNRASGGPVLESVSATHRLLHLKHFIPFMCEEALPIEHLRAPDVSRFEDVHPLGCGSSLEMPRNDGLDLFTAVEPEEAGSLNSRSGAQSRRAASFRTLPMARAR